MIANQLYSMIILIFSCMYDKNDINYLFFLFAFTEFFFSLQTENVLK